MKTWIWTLHFPDWAKLLDLDLKQVGSSSKLPDLDSLTRNTSAYNSTCQGIIDRKNQLHKLVLFYCLKYYNQSMRKCFKQLTLVALVICAITVSPTGEFDLYSIRFVHALTGAEHEDLNDFDYETDNGTANFAWGRDEAEEIVRVGEQALPRGIKERLANLRRVNPKRYKLGNPIIDHDKKKVILQAVCALPAAVFDVGEIFYRTCISHQGTEHITQALSIILPGPDSKIMCLIEPRSIEGVSHSQLASPGYYSMEELLDTFGSSGFNLKWDSGVQIDGHMVNVNSWFGENSGST